MSRCDWATNEQKKWLQDNYKEHYIKYLLNWNYMKFKPIFFEAWFQKWPVIQLKECGFPLSMTPDSLTPIQHEHLACQIEKYQKVSLALQLITQPLIAF